VLYRLKEVICFGEGAGANILARFAVRIIILTLELLLLRMSVVNVPDRVKLSFVIFDTRAL